MTAALHRRAKAIFVAASQLPADARAAFVDAQCESDGALRNEVTSLLVFHDSAGAERSPWWARTPWEGADSVGAYRLIEKIGEGGMGVVYEAEQTRPVHRRVAVKLIKWGMDTREVLARFEGERQALAMMDHPAIARVFEAGATDQGRRFFAMELVRGAAITEYCDSRRLSIPERLRLFVEVCQGVQHAHQKGVIHRDLKPSNLIVTERDGRRSAKIIDFGISRATAQRDAERTVFTRLGQWVGTPEYMSPEQAALGSLDTDTRSDEYSLGVVLYELLTGMLPFDSSALRASGYDEMRRQIREVDPQRPSTRVGTSGANAGPAAASRRLEPRGLARALRGDLDWIVMKAIDKDRSRRYGSAAELAADIARRRFEEGLRVAEKAAPAPVRQQVALHLGMVWLCFRTGNLDEAQRHADTAARLIETGIVPDDSLRADHLFMEALVLRERREYGAALRNLERCLAIRERVFGPEHASVAWAMQSLGWNELSLERIDSARRYFQRALEIDEKLLGFHHLWVAFPVRRRLSASVAASGR